MKRNAPIDNTITPINTALQAPILFAGVEKRLMLLNALLCFPLIAASHFHLASIWLAVLLFIVLHSLFIILTQYDPMMAVIFKRATRYVLYPFFPAVSHPSQLSSYPILTVTRPR